MFLVLEDVDEAGNAQHVADGRLRLSSRATHQAPYNFLNLPWRRSYKTDEHKLTPGQPVKVTIDLMPIALMYFLSLPVGIIGAVIARFRPEGMAHTLFVTALAQALLLVIVLMRNPPISTWTAAVWRGFVGNAFFALLFVASAWLFRKAARN